MDPISAVGVAAAAVEFLTFGLHALELCREIRDAQDGATKANQDLESATKDINDIIKDLSTSTRNANTGQRRIIALARDCLASSDELLKLLGNVRGAGNAKPTHATIATFKAIKARRQIEKLKASLEYKQKSLDAALTHDVR